MCRPGRVHRLRRRPVREVGEQPACERPGDSERARRRGGVGARDPADRRDAAEHAADRGGMEAPCVERSRRRHPDPADDLVAGDDRRERIAPAGAGLLGGSEGRGRDHRRDVADRFRVRVVEVEPVAQHRVRKGGVRGGQPPVRADHGRLRLPAELGHRGPALGRDPAGVSREPAAEGVEHVELRVRQDVLRDVGDRDRRAPLCDRPGGSRHLILLVWRESRLRPAALTPSIRRRNAGSRRRPRGRRDGRP